MSESSGPLSPENVRTVSVVSFILGLLALALGVFLYTQIDMMMAGVAGLEDLKAQQTKAMSDRVGEIDAMQKRIEALEKRVDEMAAAQTAAAAAPAPN